MGRLALKPIEWLIGKSGHLVLSAMDISDLGGLHAGSLGMRRNVLRDLVGAVSQDLL